MLKIFFSEEQIIKYLQEQGYTIRKKDEIRKNIKKARESRTEEIKKKIQKTIEEMKNNNETINANSLSKKAGINYRTAKKYLEKI